MSAMMISALTPAAIGASARPTSSDPDGMTSTTPATSLVLLVVLKVSDPSIAIAVSVASLTTSYVTATPAGMRTMSPSAGGRPADHVLGSDHGPLRTARVVGFAAKSGTSCGRPAL